MTQHGTLALEVNTEAFALSLRSVFDVLEASSALRQHVVDRFPDLFTGDTPELSIEFGSESIDLFFGEAVDRAALGAGKILFNPSERYLELVAAISGDGNRCTDFHGWPILSLTCGNATMANAPVESICRGGGSVE